MMPVADAEDVPAVQDEHLVGDLDVADAVAVDQHVDLLDDGVGAPVAVAVGRLAHAAGLLAALERGLDAAERAVVGTAERRVERGVGLAVAGRRGSASCGRGSAPSAAGPRRCRASRASRSATSGRSGVRRSPAVRRGTTGRAPSPGPARRLQRLRPDRPACAALRRRRRNRPPPRAASAPAARRRGRRRSSTFCSGDCCLIAVQTLAGGGHDLRRGRRLMAVDDHGGQHRVEVRDALGHLGRRSVPRPRRR